MSKGTSPHDQTMEESTLPPLLLSLLFSDYDMMLHTLLPYQVRGKYVRIVNIVIVPIKPMGTIILSCNDNYIQSFWYIPMGTIWRSNLLLSLAITFALSWSVYIFMLCMM